MIDKLAELSFLSRARLTELARQQGVELSTFQMRVLSVVGRFPGQPQQLILHRRGWDKGQVARTFRELERQGLMIRCGNSTARRITEVALTPDGQALFDCLAQVCRELTAILTEGLTADEIAQFDAVLTKVLTNVSVDPPVTL